MACQCECRSASSVEKSCFSALVWQNPVNSLWCGELGGLFDRPRVSRGVLVCRGEVVDFLKPAHGSFAATSEHFDNVKWILRATNLLV